MIKPSDGSVDARNAFLDLCFDFLRRAWIATSHPLFAWRAYTIARAYDRPIPSFVFTYLDNCAQGVFSFLEARRDIDGTLAVALCSALGFRTAGRGSSFPEWESFEDASTTMAIAFVLVRSGSSREEARDAIVRSWSARRPHHEREIREGRISNDRADGSFAISEETIDRHLKRARPIATALRDSLDAWHCDHAALPPALRDGLVAWAIAGLAAEPSAWRLPSVP